MMCELGGGGRSVDLCLSVRLSDHITEQIIIIIESNIIIREVSAVLLSSVAKDTPRSPPSIA